MTKHKTGNNTFSVSAYLSERTRYVSIIAIVSMKGTAMSKCCFCQNTCWQYLMSSCTYLSQYLHTLYSSNLISFF